jgi:hypothetical protein
MRSQKFGGVERDRPCDNVRVEARRPDSSPSYGRDGSVGLRTGSVILASCWALAGAAFGVRVFQSWWMHGPINPVTDGPMPADFYDSVLGTLVLVFLMGMLLAGLWLAVMICGFMYLRLAGLTGRWRKAWVSAVAAAAAVSVAFLWAFMDPVPPLFGQVVIGHPDWGLLAFSAAFLAVGAVMAAIIIGAERQATP